MKTKKKGRRGAQRRRGGGRDPRVLPRAVARRRRERGRDQGRDQGHDPVLPAGRADGGEPRGRLVLLQRQARHPHGHLRARLLGEGRRSDLI